LEHLNKEGLVGKREQSSFLSKVRDHVKNGFDKLKQVKLDDTFAVCSATIPIT